MRQNRNAWSISSFYSVAATAKETVAGGIKGLIATRKDAICIGTTIQSFAGNASVRGAIMQEASLASRLAAGLLVALACLALSACKQGADTSKTTEQPPRAAQESSAPAKGVEALVQRAASSCRQRIQEAAQEHAANANQLQEARVLAMNGVTQREQLEAKREVVRRFLASNAAFKSLLVDEQAAFTEALAKLNVPQAKIETESRAFQSGIRDKALIIRKRETDQHIGNALLGALDFLDELWGQWNYNREYDQVQFSPPGALKKYNDFLEAIQSAFQEQKELKEP